MVRRARDVVHGMYGLAMTWAMSASKGEWRKGYHEGTTEGAAKVLQSVDVTASVCAVCVECALCARVCLN